MNHLPIERRIYLLDRLMLFHTNSVLLDGWRMILWLTELRSYWMSWCLSTRPRNNKSFDTLVDYHLDVFIPAKLEFFSFIAKILKPYLVIFQSDDPLVPFMFYELSLVLYRLLRLLFKKKKIDKCK